LAEELEDACNTGMHSDYWPAILLYVVTVEPWAELFEVARGEECQVVALHHTAPPTFSAEVVRGGLIVTVNESGATY
jgi:hypothetical protein